MLKVRSVSLGAVVAVLALLTVPQTSEAQFGYFGRGGFGSPYFGGYGYRPGFFGPASYGYGGSFAYAYAQSYVSVAAPRVVYQPIFVTAPQTPAQNLNTSSIEVLCPPDAVIWFNGRQSQQQGPTRNFFTPLLSEGNYYYELRATWKDQSGNEVSRTREVQVSPNQHVVVNLAEEKKS